MKRAGKILLVLVVVASLASAQNRRRRAADNIYQTEGLFPSAREAVGDSYPKWDYGPRFQKDVFTFVRIECTMSIQSTPATPATIAGRSIFRTVT